MAHDGDLYSTFVVWIKVILPTAALALLSTLFLFSGKVDVTQSIPYATLNVDEIVRDQRISRPYFDAITPDGVEVSVLAAFAKPDPANPERFESEDLQIKLRDPGERAIRINSNFGTIEKSTASLSGDVTLITSDGLTIKSPELLANFDTQVFETNGGILAESELGQLTANEMKMVRGEAGLEIHFKGQVRLIYQP